MSDKSKTDEIARVRARCINMVGYYLQGMMISMFGKEWLDQKHKEYDGRYNNECNSIAEGQENRGSD